MPGAESAARPRRPRGQVQAPDLAAQVYAASLLAIEVDTDAERAYLARLAQSLALPPAAIAHIHQTLGVPQA